MSAFFIVIRKNLYMRRYFLIWFLTASVQLLFTCVLHAQGILAEDTKDCTEPTEVVINTGGISLISSGDYEIHSGSGNPVIFYKPSDKYTFWYKFIVQEACSFSFDIYPSSSTDIYNFFLYKHPGGNFCKGIIDRSIIPIRANLYKKEIHSSGTGLKKSGGATDPSEKKSMRESLYNQSYHQLVNAEAGDIYYLNVYHTAGDDCGHSINISACSKTLAIKATHKPCFEPPITSRIAEEELQFVEPMSAPSLETVNYTAEIKINESSAMEASITPVAKFSLPATEPALYKSGMKEIKLSVTEGNSNKNINSDIKVIDRESGQTVKYHIDAGEQEVTVKLDKTRKYKIVFSSLGYKNKTLEIDGTGDYSGVIPVKLNNEKAGAKLVLNNLYFHPNTYALRDESYNELESLLNFMQTNSTAKIKIVGHTSGDYHIRNSKRYEHLGPKWSYRGTSKKLSKLRAAEVRNHLLKNGIEDGRIEIQGMGGENMIITNPISNKESMVNMRVEMLILEI